jgi:hypothetical protein
MKTIPLVVSLGAALIGFGCWALGGERAAAVAQPGAPSARAARGAPAAANRNLPVICHLERRDTVITVKAGPSGPIYLVKTKAGKILHQDLTEEQLRAQAPEIHAFVKTALAGRSEKPGVVIDASLGRRPARR